MQKNRKKKPFNHLPWNGKPYNFFGDYLEKKYGCRVMKLPINASLGCPNRDGTLGTGGCVFCSEEGSASPTSLDSDDIIRQMKNAVDSFGRKFEKTRYIAYFQAYTNTYGTIPHLREIYNIALSFQDTIGLMIGTRPDCFTEETAELLSEYAKPEFELWLELGMQSIHEKSLLFLNRRHSHDDTLKAIDKAARHGIDICLHVILGIPGESWDDMMKTATAISSLPVKGVKIHHLHVIKGTPLENLYSAGLFTLMTYEEYISTLCDFIERLRGDITIHRIIGDRDVHSLIAPKWGMLKGTIQTGLENEFMKRASWQGFII